MLRFLLCILLVLILFLNRCKLCDQIKKKDYSNYKWFCGCAETIVLFCFPCLLLGGKKLGLKLVLRLYTKVLLDAKKKNETSSSHIDNIVYFNILGQYSIKFDLLDVVEVYGNIYFFSS